MSRTSAVTAVIYASTAQSFNGLALELLACEILAHVKAVRSCRLAAIAFLSHKYIVSSS